MDGKLLVLLILYINYNLSICDYILAHDSLFIAILVEINCKVHILQLNFRDIAFESKGITCEMNFKMDRISSKLQDLIRYVYIVYCNDMQLIC